MYRTRKATKRYKPEKSRKSLEDGLKECPFCQLDGRSVESTTYNEIIENKFSYQYWEFMKVTKHLMIVPKRHIESLADLNKAEMKDTMELICKYESKGYNIYAREGGSIIKTVPHQHTHLVKTDNKRARLFLYIRKPYLIWRT